MNSQEAVCRTLDALSAANIEHMVTGGLVANAHGIARSTKDADIVIQVEDQTFAAFARALPPELVRSYAPRLESGPFSRSI